MKENQKVYHKKHGGMIFKVVSPSSSNGSKYMVCEVFVANRMEFVIITDSPDNFYLV